MSETGWQSVTGRQLHAPLRSRKLLLWGVSVAALVACFLPNLVRRTPPSDPTAAAAEARRFPAPAAALAEYSSQPDLSPAAIAPEADVYAPDAQAFDSVEPGFAMDAAAPLDCLIEPRALIAVGSSVTGVIQAIHVERGDWVEAGQVLVELEDRVERAAVALATARAQMDGAVDLSAAHLELSRRRSARAGELLARQALSVDTREQLETEATVAQLELKRAKENRQLASLELDQAIAALGRRSLVSPLAGVVVERMLSPGEVVDEEPVLRIAQTDPLHVEVILPAARFGSVVPGMRAAVVPELPGDKVYAASVVIVDPVIDAASGTFGVRLDLPNSEHLIPSGLHCQVRFIEE